MRRSYPKFPLPGVGALIFKRRKILLCQRAGNPLKGWWSLPGGLVETGESLEDAVRREVLEETGLIIGQVSFFEIFERIIRDARGRAKFHYILVDYLCQVKGGELRAGDDAGRCEWVSIGDLGKYQITEGTQAVIERAAQAYFSTPPRPGRR